MRVAIAAAAVLALACAAPTPSPSYQGEPLRATSVASIDPCEVQLPEAKVPAKPASEMTQQALAERVGVTRQTIMAIEKGRYSPSLEVAFRIAGVFGVPLEEVFQYAPPS